MVFIIIAVNLFLKIESKKGYIKQKSAIYHYNKSSRW